MKTIFSCLLSILLSLSTTLSIHAQTAITLTGTVRTTTGQPAPYTSVSLLKDADSSIIRTTTANDSGQYQFTQIPEGHYRIKATAAGYTATFSPILIANDRSQTIPTLLLPPMETQLHTIEVSASKPPVEHTPGKTIVNVAGSILPTGNSALDILRRTPGVSVDKDDNISLKGKQGVNVMIDDKSLYLSPAQLATLLRATDGSTIQSIELMSNPSARYDAAGNAGIINIRLKKLRKKGTNGSIMAGTGYGKYYKDNESITLNHQEGPINVFGTFTRNDDRTAQNIHVNKEIPNPAANSTAAGGPALAGNTYFTQHTGIEGTGYNNSFRSGLDYSTGTKNTIGLLVSGHFNGENDINNDQNDRGSQPAHTDSYQNTLSTIHQRYDNIALNINDRWTDTSGRQFGVDADYSRYHNHALMQHDTYSYNPDGSTRAQPAFLKTQSPSIITIRTVRADYSQPLTPSLKLDAGIKYSDVGTDNNLDARTKIAGQYVNDSRLSNHFNYDERIAAGYFNINKSYRRIKVQAGLRAEHTSSTGNLLDAGGSAVRRHYLDLFPSLFLTHAIDEKNELSFSYSRRIDRPGYDNLNPFIYYIDQYTYQVGNPFLRPQYTNKVEWSYTYNKTINISLGFSRTTDIMTELFITKGDTSIDQTLNLNSQNYYNGNINVPFSISKWWSGNVDGTVFYTKVKSDHLLGGTLNNGKAAIQFKMTHTFQLAKNFRAELTGDYSSPQIMGIYTMKPWWGINAGISRSFADGKFNVKLAVNDLFNTYSMIATANYQTDNIYWKDKTETRVARFTLTYNFGSTHLKNPGHAGGADTENNRVKGH
jgi:iron complex outermembrane receptor protein